MAKLRLLDLFCGAGGASMGYNHAGFEVVGVDSKPQKNYPFKFHQADALTFPLEGFDVIHASPPCQAFTAFQLAWGKRKHPNLIPAVRERLVRAGTPYVIENVPGAPLLKPVLYCGEQFGLRVYRHRLFESSHKLHLHPHPHLHSVRPIKAGRPVKENDFITVVGHFSDVSYARRAMGIDWMTRDELSQAIPPAYTYYIGRQLIKQLCEVS